MKWRISQKLLTPLLLGGIIVIAALTAADARLGTQMLLDQGRTSLEGLRASRQIYIEKYFRNIRSQITVVSRDDLVTHAVAELGEAFETIPLQLENSAGGVDLAEDSLRAYYAGEFAPRLREAGFKDRGIEAYLPRSPAGRALQIIYIAGNPHPVGGKDLLDRGNQTCDYNRVHEAYHPRLRGFRRAYGYHDVFLFDLKGNLVYSVTKETDFGTNVLNGPYKDSNLAEVYRQARSLDKADDVAVVDYASYEPSYGAPASFIAAPVFQSGSKIGVAAFQVPIDEINSIVCDSAGLGETGRIYLVGDDLLMRSDTRFDSKAIFARRVETEAARQATSGSPGTTEQVSYDGQSTLASFAPVKIQGLHWGIIAEISLAEIGEAGQRLQAQIIWLGAGIGLVSLAGAWFVARRVVTRPIQRLAAGAEKVEQGHYGTRIDVATQDEMGDLARAFNHMVGAIQRDSESVRKLSMAVQQSPSAVVITDIDGNIEYINPKFTEISGYSLDEVRGKNPRVLKSGHHPPEFYQDLWGTISSGGDWKGDICNRRKNGELYWESASISPARDEDGNITHYIAVKEDITERKAAAERLAEAEERSRLLLESTSDGIFGVSTNGTVTFVNVSAAEMLGFTREQILGHGVHALVHHSRADGSPYPIDDCPMCKAYTTGVGSTVDDELLWRKDGRGFPVEYTSVPVRKGDEIVGAVVVFRDITERKETERALHDAKLAADEANKAKSAFLANMSHEIRTPMNGIIGMTDLALDTALSPEQRDYLDTVKSSADALLSLINDILDFSKIEAGKLELDPIDFGLRDAIADMLNTLGNRAHAKGLELVYDVRPEVRNALFGDVHRIRQIIVNLVGNAIKFTKSGEIVVSVEQVHEADQHVTLHFSVRDTGVGVSADKLESIFQPFSQADVSTTRNYGGTGLGLTISTQLASLMNGRIWAESEVGQGSTFHFTAVLGKGERVSSPDVSARRELVDGLRVIVVDDNATNRRVFEEMLRNWRMQPSCADSGKDALEAMGEAANTGRPFQLVLSDVNMPEMDGFMLYEKMRFLEGYKDVPVILMTSGIRPGDAQRSRDLGISAHLVKPVKQSLLLNTLVNAVAGEDAARPSSGKPGREDSMSKGEQSLRILLAEDNAVNQKFAVLAIEKAGHTVAVASNGAEAVDAWQRNAFDVVLMDVQMPEMDGLEATRRIRTLEQDGAGAGRTPIVAMTANAMKGDRERCLDAGMDGYVSKPVKRETLFAEIKRVLRKQ